MLSPVLSPVLLVDLVDHGAYGPIDGLAAMRGLECDLVFLPHRKHGECGHQPHSTADSFSS